MTATIDNWGPYYIAKVGQVLEGTWTPGCDPDEGCYFGHMNDGSVEMAPFTNMPDDVKAKAEEIKAAITAGEYSHSQVLQRILLVNYNLKMVKLLIESRQHELLC